MFVAIGILGSVVCTMYGIYWIASHTCEEVSEWSSETKRRYSWPALVQNYYGEDPNQQPGEPPKMLHRNLWVEGLPDGYDIKSLVMHRKKEE